MSSDPILIYWDSCVFLSYINGYSDRAPTIGAILEKVEKANGTQKIVTSVLTKVEVAYVTCERETQILLPETEAALDAMWNDASVIVTIDFHDDIVASARALMRKSAERGLRLKPMDAIHLASAKFMQVSEMHTYDNRDMDKFALDVGCNICRPYIEQPKLPLDLDLNAK